MTGQDTHGHWQDGSDSPWLRQYWGSEHQSELVAQVSEPGAGPGFTGLGGCGDQNGGGLAGLLRGVSLLGYLQRVDRSSCLIRPGKRNHSSAGPDILTRLESDVDCWKETPQLVLGLNKKIDSNFGGTHRLSEVANWRGCRDTENIFIDDAPRTAPSAREHSRISNSLVISFLDRHSPQGV